MFILETLETIIKKYISTLLLLVPLLLVCINAGAADKKTKSKAKVVKETPHLAVVQEYIRSICAVYGVQKIAAKEQEDEQKAEDNNISRTYMNFIRNFTKYKFEMKLSINQLKQMHLKAPFDELIPTSIELYSRKLQLLEELIKSSKILVSGVPQPGIDYAELSGRTPEITAEIEILDETIMKTMPLVFALLIDQKPDSEGHMSRLIITTDERQALIDSIDRTFGDDTNAEINKNMTWTVAAASVLRKYLNDDYRSSDYKPEED